MKLIVVLTLLGFSFAEFNSYAEFKANNKSVTDYAVELGFKNFAHQFNKFKVILILNSWTSETIDPFYVTIHL